MKARELIEKVILKYPVCEFCFGESAELVFSEKVRVVCEQECGHFARSWACPPYCGTVSENIKKCRSYQQFCLFSTVYETENSCDRTGYLKAKKNHESITAAIRDELLAILPDAYFLSSGCMLCENCTCPDKECRYPKKRLFPIESHCIVVMQTIRQAGMTDYFGNDSAVYFSMILYNNPDNEGNYQL